VLFDAIPKGRFSSVFAAASSVESNLRGCHLLLDRCRDYFLDSAAGEESPFVQQIDELVPRGLFPPVPK